MPQLWLTIAILLYGIGLAYSILLTFSGRREKLEPFVIAMVRIGALFHFVSLAESVWSTGRLSLLALQRTESLLAFLLMVLFFFTFWRYRTFSHGVFVFPLVLALTLFTVLGIRPSDLSAPARSGWTVTHVTLIVAGYAALFFTFTSSILYLVQERSLKTHTFSGLAARLPALQTIDELGFRSLLIGFPFMTLGLMAGSVIAEAAYGPDYIRDPKIVLSLIMWAVYLVLLFTRWAAGWRGRRAAVLATTAFVTASLAWAANYIGSMHGVAP